MPSERLGMGTLAFMRIFALLERIRRVLVDGCMHRTEALFNRSRERCINVSVSSASTTSIPENIDRKVVRMSISRVLITYM